ASNSVPQRLQPRRLPCSAEPPPQASPPSFPFRQLSVSQWTFLAISHSPGRQVTLGLPWRAARRWAPRRIGQPWAGWRTTPSRSPRADHPRSTDCESNLWSKRRAPFRRATFLKDRVGASDGTSRGGRYFIKLKLFCRISQSCKPLTFSWTFVLIFCSSAFLVGRFTL